MWLDAAPTGAFTVEVAAAALPGDGVPGVGDTTDQDFALVISNAKLLPPLASRVRATWGRRGGTTVLKRLRHHERAGRRCRSPDVQGQGLPAQGVPAPVRRARCKSADITRALRGRRLRRGARVTLRFRGRTSTWTVGRKPGHPRLRRR